MPRGQVQTKKWAFCQIYLFSGFWSLTFLKSGQQGKKMLGAYFIFQPIVVEWIARKLGWLTWPQNFWNFDLFSRSDPQSPTQVARLSLNAPRGCWVRPVGHGQISKVGILTFTTSTPQKIQFKRLLDWCNFYLRLPRGPWEGLVKMLEHPGEFKLC